MEGFEPPTPRIQTESSTGLSYTLMLPDSWYPASGRRLVGFRRGAGMGIRTPATTMAQWYPASGLHPHGGRQGIRTLGRVTATRLAGEHNKPNSASLPGVTNGIRTRAKWVTTARAALTL